VCADTWEMVTVRIRMSNAVLAPRSNSMHGALESGLWSWRPRPREATVNILNYGTDYSSTCRAPSLRTESTCAVLGM
jgi:hypothetical protein